MSAEYVISDQYRVSPPGRHRKGNDLEEDRRDDGETNLTSYGRYHWSREKRRTDRCGNNMLCFRKPTRDTMMTICIHTLQYSI